MSRSLVFATHYESDYSEHHGLETCIVELTKQDLKEIADLVAAEEYFESSYCYEYYNFPAIYHENGVFLEDSEFAMLQDAEEKSSGFFSDLDWSNVGEDGDEMRVRTVRSSILIPDSGCFLVTCRNQSIYLYAEGEVPDDWSGPLLVNTSQFLYGKNQESSLGFGLLTSVEAEGSRWLRGASVSEDADDELSGMHQLVINDGTVVLYVRTANESLFDTDELGLDASLDSWYDETETVLEKLKAAVK